MPLPALNRDDHHQVARSTTTVSAAKEELVSGLDSDEEEEYDDEDDEDHDQEDANEDDEDKEELQGSVQREDEATPLESDKPAAIAASSPRKPLEPEVDSSPAQTKKRPLYHQPAWISPELHAWLVASGLFATKPRCELLPSEV
ncbi:hypothetical protein PHYBOEH_000180 [Phytophthora boehmeriae]|uniref:Uncharacterized protein n=1 Tax=Phytophthora boehmeriae TaxID=109152 RepID=A0A8T1X1G2_9STRA|nr:hypothetical protein PHYBOEH_000180 [Phytophthora boehmeriae]